MSSVLRIDPHSSEPVFAQLVFQVKRAVALGELVDGDRLPSVRELARELSINPNTVVRAYDALERDGVIVRRQGAGCFVSGRPTTLNGRERRRRLADLASRLATEAFHLGFEAADVRSQLDDALGRLDGQTRRSKDTKS